MFVFDLNIYNGGLNWTCVDDTKLCSAQKGQLLSSQASVSVRSGGSNKLLIAQAWVLRILNEGAYFGI